MTIKKAILFGATAFVALGVTSAAFAQAAPATVQPQSAVSVSEVIVTAQKRQENIQNVGMSIQAASGDRLTKLGITDTQSLQKIVPGFLFTPTYYGTLVYTIRGVGFQDTSLAGSPTVTTYLDEAPLPFSALTNGATLDVQRVEVLKGPQGTLFGNNATGGAINYIANKPTDSFHAGGDLTYGRFSSVDAKGYVSGPLIAGVLDGRLALESNTSGAWQHGYGPQAGQSIGGKDFLNGRATLLWKPIDKFKALLTLNGWQDKSYNQMGQLYGIAELSPKAPISPYITSYPLAPHNDQAAGWNQCVNTSPYDPIAGQAGGALWNTPTGVAESQGPGSAVWAGAQPTHCVPPRNNNIYYSGTLRMDYDLGNDMTLTSLTEYQKFTRTAGIDGSGMPEQDYQSYQRGKITSTYQELRLAGKVFGKGNWIVGANYEYDNTWDSFLQTYNGSTASPTFFAYNSSYFSSLLSGSPLTGVALGAPCSAAGCALEGFTLGATKPENLQKTTTYAVYGDVDYPILENLNAHAGIRFTQENKTGTVCGNDGGDGSWALIAYELQQAFGGKGVLSAPGSCASVGFPSEGFVSPQPGFTSPLNQNNVSWRVGLDYKITPDNLIYFNVSKGYKGGSFPTVALSTYTQAHPVVQESLLAYEGGFKSSLFDKQVTLNGAGFYYDYSNKQILGAIPDVLFGALPALVNVPKSHVIGFELSAVVTPEMLKGLTLSGSISYQQTHIDRSSGNNQCSDAATVGILASEGQTCVPGDFYNFDAFSQLADFTGEKFPSAPEIQASFDGEYDWTVKDDLKAFVGVNVQYTGNTNTFFLNKSPLTPVGGYNQFGIPPSGPYNHPNDPAAVPAYTLLDLRAGIEQGDWRFQLWGHNVTNQYYWTGAEHVNDVLLRYTGMPVTYGFTLSYRH